MEVSQSVDSTAIESTQSAAVTAEATPASAEAVTPAADQATQAPADQSQTLGQVDPAVVAPAYTPNFKFKVKDQEKEVDEMFRALIKDQDSEKKVKELFEKAHGLDAVKQDRAGLKKELEGFKSQVTPYLQEYHQFTSLRDKGNIGAALQVAGISDDQIFEYALKRLEMESNPHQAQLYKQHTEQTLQQFQMEQELQRYKHMEQQTEAQKFQSDLQASVAKFADVASQYESRQGRQGAFMEEVIAYGNFEASKGNVLTTDQAVEAVANKFKPFFQTQQQSQPAQPAAMHKAPATLPNVSATNISPIKKQVESLDDIRKLARA